MFMIFLNKRMKGGWFRVGGKRKLSEFWRKCYIWKTFHWRNYTMAVVEEIKPIGFYPDSVIPLEM